MILDTPSQVQGATPETMVVPGGQAAGRHIYGAKYSLDQDPELALRILNTEHSYSLDETDRKQGSASSFPYLGALYVFACTTLSVLGPIIPSVCVGAICLIIKLATSLHPDAMRMVTHHLDHWVL